jgi:hypothetical protein
VGSNPTASTRMTCANDFDMRAPDGPTSRRTAATSAATRVVRVAPVFKTEETAPGLAGSIPVRLRYQPKRRFRGDDPVGVVGEADELGGVAEGDSAGIDLGADRVGEAAQREPLRHVRLGLADPLGDPPLRPPERLAR